MTAKRICWTRFDGKLPDGAKSVARPSRYGNNAKVKDGWTRAEAVYIFAVEQLPTISPADIEALRGKDLACACPLDGLPCHADVLIEAANGA